MTQRSFVPIEESDQVRGAYRLETPRDWRPIRPGDLRQAGQPRGRSLGVPAPDNGYGLLLAERLFADKVEVVEGETVHDALHGAAAVAGARAAMFGRAPVAKDLELALTLFGYLGGAPADLVAWRKALFQAAAHEYLVRRRIAEAVPEATLRLTPAQVGQQLAKWRSLVVADWAAVPTDVD